MAASTTRQTTARITMVLRPRWLCGLPMTDDPLNGSWCSADGTMPRERNSPMITSGSRPR